MHDMKINAKDLTRLCAFSFHITKVPSVSPVCRAVVAAQPTVPGLYLTTPTVDHRLWGPPHTTDCAFNIASRIHLRGDGAAAKM